MKKGRTGDLGFTYYDVYNSTVITSLKQSLQILKYVFCGDWKIDSCSFPLSFCLERTGDDYLCRGDFKQATACFQQFLGIAEEKGDKPAEARVYGKLGDVYEGLHDFNHAMKCHTKRLVIAKELGDRLEEGVAYSSIGNAYESRGDFHRAIEYHNFHLAIAKEIGDRAGEGTSYGNLGDAYERLGNFGQAMKYRKLHLTIAKEVGDRVGLGAAYSRLGKAYHNFGDFKQAIEYHNQHLAIAKERGDKVEEGIAYCNLGIAYHRLGDFSKAVEYHEEDLCIAREVGDTAGEGASYGNLGNIYHSIGDYQQAIEYHQMHLSIARRVGSSVDEGAAYCNLGRAYQALGDFEKAVTLYERDLVISKELDDRSGEGTSYGNLGSVYEKIGDFEKAIEYHRQSLNIAKDVGDRSGEGLACGNLGKAYYGLGNFVTAIECHKQQLSLAKKVGDKALEADACYSLGRAFEMTGSLIEALDNFRSSVEIYDSLKALLESRDSWKINFRDVYENAYRSLWRTLLRLQKTEEALFVADQGRAQALVDLMKEQYGFYSTAPCEHKEMIGDFVNDVSSQVVFVALESDKINVWVLGQGNEIQFRQKPEEAEYVHEFPFPTAESSWRRLYDAVIGPVADLLHGDELIIVPDGPLWLAPYAAFLDHDSRYLSETFRIRLIPSLTSLKLILDCPGDYHCKSGVLLVGDPCSETGRRRFPRLPHAKKEVEMIGKMFQSTPLTGEDATKEAVLERMGSVALIHIAAHSSSGEIVLAASEFSNDQDSFLSEEDVKAMKLRARLVVLSCSHFAVHEDIKAEGVFGIARAFLGAGARSVVVSLRGIDDEAAMKFMENFYHHLGGGYSASVALQHAQKCLRESEDFAAEMHWAPFVLIGDDVTIELR